MILLVYPGFGGHNIIHKQNLLINNLGKLKSNEPIDIMVFSHSDDELELLKNLPNVTIKYEKGVIGEFLFRHVTPEVVEKYSHVIISMDDIELLDDVDIDVYTQENIDIISPSLSEDSQYTHSFMLNKKNQGMESTPFLELFFYVMTVATYKRYYEIFIDENVSWLWYIDCILQMKGFTCAIDHGRKMHHHYLGSSKDMCALMETIYNRDKLTISRNIIQTDENTITRENHISFNYTLFSPEKYIEDNYPVIYRSWNMHDTSEKYFYATLLYIYEHGGIYLEGEFKDISPILKLLEEGVGRDFVLGKNIIIGKRHSQNILSYLLHKRIKNPSTFAYLDDMVVSQFKN